MYLKFMLSRKVISNSLATTWSLAHGLLHPWDFSGKNTGVGCHFLLQGIFPTQVSNSRLLHWKEDSLPLSHLRQFISISVQFSSVQSCPTLCNPVNHSTPGLPVQHKLPELLQLMSLESVTPFSHLILCPPPPLLPPIPPSIRVFFQGVKYSHEVAKVLEFQLQPQSFQ